MVEINACMGDSLMIGLVVNNSLHAVVHNFLHQLRQCFHIRKQLQSLLQKYDDKLHATPCPFPLFFIYTHTSPEKEHSVLNQIYKDKRTLDN